MNPKFLFLFNFDFFFFHFFFLCVRLFFLIFFKKMDKNISISVTTDVIACDGSSSRREILYEFGIKYQNASISGDFQKTEEPHSKNIREIPL